ncbi:MAG: hypothetical protein M3081_18680 [Gemmatimonadota bacterium]|nr:hypothetical protein [Gemmatimonadota bacterium]
MRAGGALLLWTSVSVLLTVPAIGAQQLPVPTFRATSLGALGADSIPASTPVQAAVRAASPRRGSWWTPVASAIVPGGGQALLGQSRAVPYLLLEGFAWAQYASKLHAARAGRDEYRRIARVVARSIFSDSLPVGGFEYYETMERFVDSGVFDLNPGGPLDPETDPATFNGSIWLLARRTFWENPDVAPSRTSLAWKNAESFYRQRAVGPEYRWSWRDAQLEQDLFRRTIQQSNGAFRVASDYLGLIIANHALSTVDAYVTVRLHRSANLSGDGANYGFDASIPWAPFGRPSR